jgi:hypothetical protein
MALPLGRRWGQRTKNSRSRSHSSATTHPIEATATLAVKEENLEP